MFTFHLQNLITAIKQHSWQAIIGRSKEILNGFFCKSHTLPNVTVEENDGSQFHQISIVAIVKNEALYIREWIEYHLIIGVEHFYIYDNESNDDLRSILDFYIKKGIVSYIFCPGTTMQMPAYNDASVRFRKNNRWIGFIDIDEFVVINPKYYRNLNEVLTHFESYDMLGINWCMYDCNGKKNKPTSGYVISNYTRRFANDNHPLNRHFKCFVKPNAIKVILTPHYMHLFRGKKAVNENEEKLITPFPPQNSLNKIRINHYFSKSEEEYVKKISRGRSDIAQKRSFSRNAFDFSYEKTKENDIDMQKYIDILNNKIPDTYR